jgi:hypothetical protein
MATARAEADWNRTAAIMAVTCEIHRDKKRRAKPFTPDEFHPLIEKPAPMKAPNLEPLKAFLRH